MYMGSTRNGIEFCFSSQTVLILLLLLKTVCGIELLSFKLIVWLMACSQANHNALGHLTDVLFRFLGSH